jgi:hypothetical protein
MKYFVFDMMNDFISNESIKLKIKNELSNKLKSLFNFS